MPLRFSTIRTNRRRLAWRSAWTTLKTTELRRAVSVGSRPRSIMTRSASSRVLISPEAPKMQRAELGNLAFLEEAVADEIPRLLLLWLGEQPDRRVHVREVVPGLRNLRLVRRDPPEDLGALLTQRLDDQ